MGLRFFSVFFCLPDPLLETGCGLCRETSKTLYSCTVTELFFKVESVSRGGQGGGGRGEGGGGGCPLGAIVLWIHYLQETELLLSRHHDN